MPALKIASFSLSFKLANIGSKVPKKAVSSSTPLGVLPSASRRILPPSGSWLSGPNPASASALLLSVAR
ncbi:hypothetical protein D3C80_993790 [compost metagenome]